MEIFSNLFLFFKGGHIYGTLSDHLLWSFFISIPDQASPSEEHHNWWLQVCWQPLCAKKEQFPPPRGGGPLKKRHPDPETDGVPMCHRASIIFSTLWRMENYIPPSKSYLWDHDPSMTIQSIHFLSQQIWTTWHCVNQFLSIY